MLAIIISVLITIMSILMSVFLLVSNFQYSLERDYIDRARSNGVLHAFYWGQLQRRSKNINATNNQTSLKPGYLSETDNKLTRQTMRKNQFDYNITWDNNDKLKMDIKIKDSYLK